MNGVRSIFRRKGYLLTALTAAVLLAASSGTAWAQGTVSDVSVSLASATVNEGGEATATVKFTVTATAEGNGLGANPVEVGFGFHTEAFTPVGGTVISALAPGLAGGVASNASFIGLNNQGGTAADADLERNEQIVQISSLREGRKKDYTVRHTFGLNHGLDAEDAIFRLAVNIGGAESMNSDSQTTSITGLTAVFLEPISKLRSGLN